MVRITSWNVNGIRAAVRNGMLDWFATSMPEVLCLQEVRALPEDIDDAIHSIDGYRTYWHPAQKKGYSGVGTLTKRKPVSVRDSGIAEFDDEGRIQALEFGTFFVVNAYFPNSQPERARLDYKLRFVNAVTQLCDELSSTGKGVVLCGDYNIAHTEIDLARPKPNENNPGYYIEERQAMTAFLEAGYIDTFRHFCKEPGHYTWWSYRGRARENNVGWRLDYHCVNKDFIRKVKACTILNEVRGSDHCPVELTLSVR